MVCREKREANEPWVHLRRKQKETNTWTRSSVWDLLNLLAYKDKNGSYDATMRFYMLTGFFPPYAELWKDPAWMASQLKMCYDPVELDWLTRMVAGQMLPIDAKTLWGPEWENIGDKRCITASPERSP